MYFLECEGVCIRSIPRFGRDRCLGSMWKSLDSRVCAPDHRCGTRCQEDDSGIFYEKGDERRVDDTMDGDKFAAMLVDDVFPAIRAKLPDAQKVTVQWDNARGHGVSSIPAS